MPALDLDALEVYADVELLVIGWLRDAFGSSLGGVGNELPPLTELAAALPFVQVEAFGGSDTTPAHDRARIDVDVYVGADADGNPDRGAAHDLAEQIRAALLYHLPGYVSGQATVSDVSTFSRPTARPYDDDQSLRRFSAAYTITVATR